jgi:RNA-binding protein YhbY
MGVNEWRCEVHEVLNINHLVKIRLLESKIEEVQKSAREIADGLL